MGSRILVIRGGAIGDFILTLPAIGLIRESFPDSHLEILGYKHIVALAEGRHYADGTRCIEYAAMAAFFVPGSELAAELVDYFASFQQVVSFLYDPNGYFEANLRRAGVCNFLNAYQPHDDSEHAALQLARPLQALALYLESPAATLYPNAEDVAFAASFLRDGRVVAIHPGSGSRRKNWMADRWWEVCRGLLAHGVQLLVVGGEADHEALASAEGALPASVLRAVDLPLPRLAAVLQRCKLFLGHDSGVSHLAAAVGTPAVLLFGSTDPTVWAPANPHVRVLEAPAQDFSQLQVGPVLAAALGALGLAGSKN